MSIFKSDPIFLINYQRLAQLPQLLGYFDRNLLILLNPKKKVVTTNYFILISSVFISMLIIFSYARTHYRAFDEQVNRVGCHYIAFLTYTPNGPMSYQLLMCP